MSASGFPAAARALVLPAEGGEFRVGLDPIARVARMENHDAAYELWREAGEKQRILVHVDAHHDMWWIKSPALLSVANFICPTLQEDIVREIFWVVPDGAWQPAQNRRHILHHAERIVKEYAGETGTLAVGEKEVSARVLGKRLTIGTLESIPRFEEPVLLDIDVDFCLLPRVTCAPTSRHSPLPWCWPEDLLKRLRARQLRADRVTIAYSVEGGYTPLTWKYLGDETALRLQQPNRRCQALDGMTSMREAAEGAQRGDFAAAEAGYEKARDLLPDSAAPMLHLAYVKLRTGHLTDARRYYQQALALDPTYRTPFNSAGPWRYWERRDPEAEIEFRRILALDPADAHAHLGLGWLAERKKSWSQAETWLRKALDLDANLVDAWRALGNVLAAQQRDAEALCAYETSLRLALAGNKPLLGPIATHAGSRGFADPDHCRVFARLARLYARKGDPAEAIKRYRISLADNAGGPGARWWLAYLYAKQRQWGEAFRQVWQALRNSVNLAGSAFEYRIVRVRRSFERAYDAMLADRVTRVFRRAG